MLFDNELLKLEIGTQSQIQLTNEAINAKYTEGDVRIVTEQARYPLDTIKGLVESGNYELRPDFQRRHRWDIVRKSRLIESFIMNVPIPPVFLYENEYAHYEVMDGLQRLTAVYEFYCNKYALQGLQFWPELDGKKYNELPEKIKQGIDRRYIASIVLLHESAKDPLKAQEMKQIVFERINSGGIKLERQEVRNALYNGPMGRLCEKLSDNETFRIILGILPIDNNQQLSLFSYEEECVNFDNQETEDVISEELLLQNDLYREMRDVEFVLRFFAMRQTPIYSQTTLGDFFDKYLIAANKNFDDDLLERLSSLFNETVSFVYNLFGERAFYLYRQVKQREKQETTWSWFSKPTAVIYDPMMYAASQFLDKQVLLLGKKDQICSELIEFYKANGDSFKGRNANRSDIENRKSLFVKFFKKFCEV